MPTSDNDAEGRYAYERLERVLHEKARLGIMTSLMTHPEGLLFTDLKQLCSLSDGNLSRHLEVLSEAELVEIWKGYEKKKPRTLVRLSKSGRKRFLEYLGELERVIRDGLSAARNAEKQSDGEVLPPGWARA